MIGIDEVKVLERGKMPKDTAVVDPDVVGQLCRTHRPYREMPKDLGTCAVTNHADDRQHLLWHVRRLRESWHKPHSAGPAGGANTKELPLTPFMWHAGLQGPRPSSGECSRVTSSAELDEATEYGCPGSGRERRERRHGHASAKSTGGTDARGVSPCAKLARHTSRWSCTKQPTTAALTQRFDHSTVRAPSLSIEPREPAF